MAGENVWKNKTKTFSQSISQQGTTTSINEKMDNMIPAGKIAALKTGEMVGMIAGGEENDTEEYKTSAISGKINLDMKAIEWEEKNYVKCLYIVTSATIMEMTEKLKY